METVFKEKGYDSMNGSLEDTPGSPTDIQLDDESMVLQHALRALCQAEFQFYLNVYLALA